MIPHYNFSIDCHENMKNAYKQGADDMRKKIHVILLNEATTTKELKLISKIRGIVLSSE